MGPFPLQVSWDYVTHSVNSIIQTQNLILGADRILSYQRSIKLYKTATIETAYVARPDGNTYHFTLDGSSWTSDSDVYGVLTASYDSSGNITGWTYLNPEGETETYSGNGVLLSIQNNQGFIQQLTYNSNDQLITVTGPQGRTLTFQYNSAGQIGTITEPDGGQLILSYGSSINDLPVNLQTITYPDGHTLTYVYNESAHTSGQNFPNALTGVVDENGNRYSTTEYNSSGLATDTFLSGNNDTESATYTASSDKSYQVGAVITKPLGETEAVTNTTVLGVVLPTKIVSSCASGCTPRTATYGYNANGKVNAFTDYDGNTTTYSYDAAGLENQQVEAQGTQIQRTTNTTWNDEFKEPLQRILLDAQGNQSGSATYWSYNDRGQVVARCIVASGIVVSSCSDLLPAPGIRHWTYSYCDTMGSGCPIIGLLLSVTGPGPDVISTTQYTYHPSTDDSGCGTGGSCHQIGDLETVTDALGHQTQYVSYDRDGRPIEIIDPNGVITTLSYTPRGWLQSRTVAGATTTISYDAVGNIISVTQPDGVFTTYSYDGAHRLTSITDALGNHVDFTLDFAGNRIAENIFASGGTTASQSQSLVYNPLDELVESLDGYNQATQYGYDANGNRTDMADPLGIRTHGSYDAMNRLDQTVRGYLGTNPATSNTTTTLSYDGRNNVVQVTDPNSLNTDYSYSDFNNLNQQISPDTGTTNNQYDLAGNRTSKTDARGVKSTMTYDALNRLVSTSYPTTALNRYYDYDQDNSITGCAVSDPIGHLTEMVDSTGDTTWCYDSWGNVVLKKHVVGSNAYTTSYTWNNAHRLMGITYPDGAGITYTRDNDGRIASVSAVPVGGINTAVVSSIGYLPFGPATNYSFASGDQSLTKLYDLNYRATDIEGTDLNLHFQRDALGNITAEGDASGVPSPYETYQYDPLYRLSQVDDASTPWQSYTYNKTGDRLTKTMAAGTSTYSYTTGTHHLVGISGPDASARTLDAEGNTTSLQAGGATYDFSYNDVNRLSQVQQGGTIAATYGVNGLGERVEKTLADGSTEAYVYDKAGRLLGEYNATQTRDYVWAGNTLVAILDNPAEAGGNIHYVYTDGLGTPRAVTTQAGTQVWTWAYNQNPFGEQQPSGGYTLNLRYPGQYFDQEDGLNYNLFRDYEAGTGRYIEPDPMGLKGGLDLYNYVGSNPLKTGDARGLDIYIANTAQIWGLHEKIVVGQPGGVLYAQSFGLAHKYLPEQWFASGVEPTRGGAGNGVVYEDKDPITKIEYPFYMKTTPREDAIAIAYLHKQLKETGPYNVLTNNCRGYSKEQYLKLSRIIDKIRQ